MLLEEKGLLYTSKLFINTRWMMYDSGQDCRRLSRQSFWLRAGMGVLEKNVGCFDSLVRETVMSTGGKPNQILSRCLSPLSILPVFYHVKGIVLPPRTCVEEKTFQNPRNNAPPQVYTETPLTYVSKRETTLPRLYPCTDTT